MLLQTWLKPWDTDSFDPFSPTLLRAGHFSKCSLTETHTQESKSTKTAAISSEQKPTVTRDLNQSTVFAFSSSNEAMSFNLMTNINQERSRETGCYRHGSVLHQRIPLSVQFSHLIGQPC